MKEFKKQLISKKNITNKFFQIIMKTLVLDNSITDQGL